MSSVAFLLPSVPSCLTLDSHYYFRIWSEKDETGVSILDKALQKLVKQIRNEDLRRDKTTFGIVDAQSVQNADTAEEKGLQLIAVGHIFSRHTIGICKHLEIRIDHRSRAIA